MRNLWIVFKNELMRYFISPLAYIYLMSFLLLNGVATFYFGHLFERGQASLFYMFYFLPWLYLLFLPGISMRLWAEEFKSKSIVQIMTMPVTLPTLVWGKFLASLVFCLLALLLTFPFVITVYVLGQPDGGVIFLSYLAGATLAGAMLAISQTMSALTKNQVIALVLAVIANLVFFFSGFEFVLS
ncbi:MAG TPA: ABC transporter permease, partial [Alphaproteobacteria bacterium]|nr:ABC transporter permease [Alphaproteobacteria bacterium]